MEEEQVEEVGSVVASSETARKDELMVLSFLESCKEL